jgi:hypothetical protein
MNQSFSNQNHSFCRVLKPCMENNKQNRRKICDIHEIGRERKDPITCIHSIFQQEVF